MRHEKSVAGNLTSVHMSYTEIVPDTHCHFFLLLLLIQLKVHTDYFEYRKINKSHTLIHTTEDKHTMME